MKTNMRSLMLGAALASGTALGSVAFAQEMAPVPTPMPAPTAAKPQAATEAYANAAAIGDMFEIEAANLAWDRSKSENVKAFAKMMIADHTATSAKLKVLVDQNDGALPGDLDESHDAMLDQLKAADDAQFDQLYLSQQETAHEEALKLHQDYAANGDNDAFKTFASDTAKKVQEHMKALKTLTPSQG
ncbi:MAG: DUF4142 domain-containing protein [Alphaproteobacteria bacterium]|nr:DUF4142 domain-containing protein [Alphaproteobacteria bacterium]